MKKVLGTFVAGLLCLTMVLGLTACGGPTEEQSAKMEELMTELETIVSDCQAEYDVLAAAMEGDEGLAEVTQTMDTVNQSMEEMRKAFDENKSSYSEEKADQVIAAIEDQIEKAETFLKALQDANAASIG